MLICHWLPPTWKAGRNCGCGQRENLAQKLHQPTTSIAMQLTRTIHPGNARPSSVYTLHIASITWPMRARLRNRRAEKAPKNGDAQRPMHTKDTLLKSGTNIIAMEGIANYAVLLMLTTLNIPQSTPFPLRLQGCTLTHSTPISVSAGPIYPLMNNGGSSV